MHKYSCSLKILKNKILYYIICNKINEFIDTIKVSGGLDLAGLCKSNYSLSEAPVSGRRFIFSNAGSIT